MAAEVANMGARVEERAAMAEQLRGTVEGFRVEASVAAPAAVQTIGSHACRPVARAA